MIKIKRVYEEKQRGDGYRVLVDRLWPRGIKKSELELDEWSKEISPSSELRKTFSHDPEKFDRFQKAYQKELKSKDIQEKLAHLVKKARKSNVTLLYAARDEVHNNATVLKAFLEEFQV